MVAKTLDGKVAVVTGARSGIGQAAVQLLLSHGARVAALDITDIPACGDVSGGDEFLLHKRCDVSSNAAVTETITSVIARWGRVDILINSAGVIDHFAAAGNTTDDDWRRCFSVNVDGPMHLIRACVPHFLAQDTDSCIVNMCSTASIRGAACGTAYTASKHALMGLSRSTAWMYAKSGIRCNAIVLGPTAGTNMVANVQGAFDEFGFERTQNYVRILPAVLRVEDIMPTMLYLVTAPGVNGAELAVDHAFTTA